MVRTGNQNNLYRLNKAICILFCIWFAWPFASYRLGMYFGVVLSLLWIATTGVFLFMMKWNADLLLTICFFITLLPYVLTGTFKYSTFNPLSLLGTFYLFFIGMFIFQYYHSRNDLHFLGLLAIITLFFYGIGSIQTIIGLFKYPAASRYLAVGNPDPVLRTTYTNAGIGGFNYVYSAIFLLIIMANDIVKKRSLYPFKYKMLVLLALTAMLFMIVRASYAIALMMSFLGCALVLFVRRKRTFYILAIQFVCIMLIFSATEGFFSTIFFKLADVFDSNPVIYEKLRDLALTFGNLTIYSQTTNRIQLYYSSFRSFLSNPLFGVHGPFGTSSYIVGGHSGWLDLMAYYGLFATIPLFLAIGSNFIKIIRINRHNESTIGILVVQVLFIALGIINPILYVYHIGLVVFLIVPSVPYICWCLGCYGTGHFR